MTIQSIINATKYVFLFNAIMTRSNFNIDDLRLICSNGMQSGFSGFIFYYENTEFYNLHSDDIIDLLSEVAHEYDLNVIDFVLSFNCIKDDEFTATDVLDVIRGKQNESDDFIKNGIVWFCVEHLANLILNEMGLE